MYPIGVKLGVREFFYTHVGRYVGDGQVFHNHWKNDAEIITFDQFAKGKEVRVLDQGVQSIEEFMRRIQHVLASGKPYNFLTNNCEHTASYVSNGVTSSPQLIFLWQFNLVGRYVYSAMMRASVKIR